MKMKKLFFYASIVALFCSCNKNSVESDQPYPENSNEVISLSLKMVVLDESFNDRLNPESEGYFGDEYVKGMKFFFFDSEVKGFEDPELAAVATAGCILPPSIWREHVNCYVNQGSRGYYFFPCGTIPYISFPDDNKGVCFYILYPDGNKDEVKTVIRKAKNVTHIGKIWINDELAYQNDHGPNALNKVYYNPKFFPFMKPVFDDQGKKIGEIPDYGSGIFLTMIK